MAVICNGGSEEKDIELATGDNVLVAASNGAEEIQFPLEGPQRSNTIIETCLLVARDLEGDSAVISHDGSIAKDSGLVAQEFVVNSETSSHDDFIVDVNDPQNRTEHSFMKDDRGNKHTVIQRYEQVTASTYICNIRRRHK